MIATIMGVAGLWKPAVQVRTLTQVATVEGFESQRRGSCTLFIGVDASILLNRAQYAAYHQKGGLNMQAGENLPLQILFWQICRMLALPVTPVYVFEGNKGPLYKRGREVKTTPHALTNSFQELLTSVGFHFYVAPGEAEAELAELSKSGKIDAVMTEDVDAFLFGATHVFRIPNISKDGDLVSIYTLDTIQSSLSLSTSKMVLIAILSGGDYDTEGLSGCGIDTALKLNQNTSPAEDLY
ncbi:hypothetical protein D9615_002450 [Tricholomella constricta]|uniref:XPG-I domain-containing protein n=1 Tax=Tricholomella constricta TaxID=117010 RepID=A0A8H5M9W4_9AGAR|nr:hypothetical protein D9615_002450 [Tricholomella constricta]